MVYVISDLHGYPLEDLQELLEKGGFSDGDYCFVLGDVIDRGEDGARILEWLIYQPNVQLILGNHESMLLSCDFLFNEISEQSISKLTAHQMECLEHWKENGAEPTLRGLVELDAETREGIVEYLREAPLYEEVELNGKKYILTHSGLGGFSPEKELCEYTERQLLWNRPSPDDRYYSGCITVFGHTPTHFFGSEHRGKVLITDTWIDIDTGAACGLAPTLLRLDDMQTFSLDRTENKQ